MRNLKVTLSYDGTDFRGWQRLPKGRTVQGEVEKAITRVIGTPCEATGSGRTDSGVHARGQVANFRAETGLPCPVLMGKIAAALPEDIACLSCDDVDERFHARYAAKAKTYRYRILESAVHDPFEWKYSWRHGERLDIEEMKRAAEVFEGTHDFSSFTNLKEKDKSFVRTVHSAIVERSGRILSLIFTGDGFLTNQVRIMAGALAMAGSGDIKAMELERIREAKDRSKAPPMAPPSGLFLEHVRYE